MRKKQLWIGFLILAVGLALAANSALAEKGKGRWGDGDRPNRMERMADRLDLTDEQQAAIETIVEARKDKAVEHKKEMARLHNEMQGEMLKDEPSEAALTKLIEKIGALRTQHQVDRMKERMAIRNVLTPEQRDKMFLMGPRHGFGQDGGPGMRGPGHRGKGHRGHDGRPGPRGFGQGMGWNGGECQDGPWCDAGPGAGFGHGWGPGPDEGWGSGPGQGWGPGPGPDCPLDD